MQNIAASNVLRKAWSLWTGQEWDTAAPGGTDFGNLRLWLDSRLKEAWHFAFWPDLLRLEKRFFAELWAETYPWITSEGYFVVDGNGDRIYLTRTYAAGDFVYYPNTELYYVALQASQNVIPDGNLDYWAIAQRAYDAPYWADATNYVVGDQVYVNERDAYYQCITAHLSSAPFTDTNWGQLYPLERSVSYTQYAQTRIGSVIALHDKSPRLSGNATEMDQWMTESGVTTISEVNYCYVEFRIRPPTIRGTVYNNATTYAVDDQVYYTRTDNSVGDFYTCISTQQAGEDPEQYAVRWQKVEIPHYFEEFLVYAILANALRSDGATEKATEAEGHAYSKLADAEWQLLSQQKHTRRPLVWTR